MSDIKCPVCGEKIEHIIDGWCNCKNRCIGSGSISLWQELIRIYKALEIAVDALKRANNTYCAEEEDITIDLTESAAHKWQRTAYQMEMPISIALEQITALEQKD